MIKITEELSVSFVVENDKNIDVSDESLLFRHYIGALPRGKELPVPI